MLKKTITYTDFDGVERVEDFYFNLTVTELIELESQGDGEGMADKIRRIVQEGNNIKILSIFKDIVLKAYGERSEDGRRFIKNDQLAVEFSQTPAYDALITEFFVDADSASDFINGVIPSKLLEQIKAEQAVSSELGSRAEEAVNMEANTRPDLSTEELTKLLEERKKGESGRQYGL